jgi:hypothetical protein
MKYGSAVPNLRAATLNGPCKSSNEDSCYMLTIHITTLATDLYQTSYDLGIIESCNILSLRLYRVHQKHLTVFEMKIGCFKAKWQNLLTQINQRSISTKLQTALCTMTVSMEASRSRQASF